MDDSNVGEERLGLPGDGDSVLPGGEVEVAGRDEMRRASGSFNGPDESDEDEVAFRGCRRSSQISRDNLEGYQRLESIIGPGSPEEEKLKRKLKFFFMNPVEKYYATRYVIISNLCNN